MAVRAHDTATIEDAPDFLLTGPFRTTEAEPMAIEDICDALIVRENGTGQPAPYPVACRPQAWAAGAVPLVLTSILGLYPNAPRGELFIVRPQLPPGSIELRCRSCASATAR